MTLTCLFPFFIILLSDFANKVIKTSKNKLGNSFFAYVSNYSSDWLVYGDFFVGRASATALISLVDLKHYLGIPWLESFLVILFFLGIF